MPILMDLADEIIIQGGVSMKRFLNETHFYGDNVHKAIPHTTIEGFITNFGSILRLHRISQNSLAFQTHPSNKTKRFEHSLGTMKLAGEFFLYLTANTKENTLDQMLKDFMEDLKIIYQKEKQDIVRHYPQDGFDTYLDKIDRFNYHSIDTFLSRDVTFYSIYTPGNIKDNQRLLYAVLFQGIRLAGLLHDVGHLPYSHAIEDVLKDLKNDFETKEADSATISTSESNFLSTIRQYGKKGLALHEEIGLKFLSLVQRKVVQDIYDEFNDYPSSYDDKFKEEYISFLTLSFLIAKLILGEYKDKGVDSGRALNL